MSTDIAVTGSGIAIASGLRIPEVRRALWEGESGIGRLSRFRPRPGGASAAAELPEFDLKETLRFSKLEKFMGPNARAALLAAREALQSSGLDLSGLDPFRVGIYCATGETGLDYSDFGRALRYGWKEDEKRDYGALGGRAARLIDPYFSLRTLSNLIPGLLGIEWSIQGPSQNFVHSDPAGISALTAAADDLVFGHCDVALVGGADSLLQTKTYLNFSSRGLLSGQQPESVAGPFDEARDGIVLGEGAGFLVLERQSDLQISERSSLAELRGTLELVESEICPWSRRTARRIEAWWAEQFCNGAPDFVIAHGLGTPADDRAEAEALRPLLADTPVTAFKGFTGYLGAATAPVEVILGLMALGEGRIPAITRLRSPDGDLEIPLVAGAAIELKNARSFVLVTRGWGGQVALLHVRTCQ